MRDNNMNIYNDLNFEKLNETLANPEFANWYYNKITNDENLNVNIGMFVNIVKKYSEGEYK